MVCVRHRQTLDEQLPRLLERTASTRVDRPCRTCADTERAAPPGTPLGAELDAYDDLDRDDRRGDPVDGSAEGRPPPRAGDESRALLPSVLHAMGREPDHDEPRRSGDAGGGD